MGNIDLSSKSYNINKQENALVIVDGANQGDFTKNSEMTMNSIHNQANFLKTHPDFCTKQNVAVLKEVTQKVVAEIKGHKGVPPAMTSRAKHIEEEVKRLAA